MKFNYKVIPVGGLKLPRILLAMKLTIVIMVATLSAVSANTYSHMVTLREKNISSANVEPLTDKIIHNTIVTVGLDNPNIKLNAPKDIIIKGTVSDSRGLTLPGVSIKIKGTMVGVSTDIDGKYSISVPDANAILVFSSIGFNSQEITVGDRSSLDVKMTE
jgi:hypothetical protein